MTQDVNIAVGTVIYASTQQPATYDAVGFNSLTYTEIGEATNLGEYGGSAQMVQHIPIKTGIIKKLKGSIDYGTLALNIGKLVGNTGQQLLKDGFDGANRDTVFSFKIVNSDGAIGFFSALVGSYTFVTNDANTVLSVNSNVELVNKVIEDNSSAVVAPTIAAAFAPPDGVVGTPYSYNGSIVFAGSVDEYSMSGTLPAGLQIDNDTGFIYGTPTTIEVATPLDMSASNDGGTVVSADAATINIT